MSKFEFEHRWILSYAIATVVSAVAMLLKVVLFVQQLRERRMAFDSLDNEQTDAQKKLDTHRKKFVKTLRSVKMIYASLLVMRPSSKAVKPVVLVQPSHSSEC